MRRARLITAVVAATVLAGSVTAAACVKTVVPGTAGTFSACYDSGGTVKFLLSGTKCPRGWFGPVTWQASGSPGATGPAGPTGETGPAGADGVDGASAYGTWLAAGNVGTEAEFLAALRGPAGADAVDGKSAYQVWLDAGHSGTELDFLASLVGPAGADGTGSLSALEGAACTTTDGMSGAVHVTTGAGTDAAITLSCRVTRYGMTLVAVGPADRGAGSVTGPGVILTQHDGEVVSGRTFDGLLMRDVAYGDGTFVAVGTRTGPFGVGQPGVFVSTDGVTWTTIDHVGISVAFDGSRWLVNGGRVVGNITSTDGRTWTTAQPTDWSPYRMVGGTGTWVGIGSSELRSSTDGSTWTQRVDATATSTLWWDVEYGAGRFVAVGSGGAVAVSTDGGITWARTTTEPAIDFRAVGTDGQRWVALGDGQIQYSDDGGATWQSAPPGNAGVGALTDVDWADGSYVGVGPDGQWASTDGLAWSRVSEGDFQALALG